MKHLIDIATDRRVTIAMFTLAIVLFGFVSFNRLKVNLLPDLSYPTLTVRTELTGAAPLETENLLSKPIEEAVGVIKNVRRVRSVSRSGRSDVVLEFTWGTDMDLAAVDVREKLDIIQLPLEAERPLILRFDPGSEPIMRYALISEPEPAVSEIDRLKRVRRYAEDRLKTQLESVEGSAAVKVSGGYEDEIQILVDQTRLALLGLSIDTIARRIEAENVNLSGGSLEQGTQRFLVRTINEFTSLDQIANSIIATPEGRPIYVRDVAEVVRGYKEREAITRIDGKRVDKTRIDGRESIELAIYKEGDANTVQVAQRVKRRIEALRKELPGHSEKKGQKDGEEASDAADEPPDPGRYDLIQVYDQSSFIESAIGQVRNAALIGGLLAILVLYFFLRDARSTFIIGLTIPVSVIGTFMLMYGSDITLNIMSLGGIALAIGLLVDNSIVVLENIARKREQGESVLDAARSGTAEVATAITAATLTTVAVFFPMVFVSGIAGQLFKDQALTVTFALLFSLIVAITLIPMLAALGAEHRFKETTDPTTAGVVTRVMAWPLRLVFMLARLVGLVFRTVLTPFVWAFQGFYGGVQRVYKPTLKWSLNNRLIVVTAALVIFGSTMLLIPRLGTELIPQLSQGEFYVDLRLAPGAPLAETDRAIQRAHEAAARLDALDMAYSVAGTGNRLDADPVDAGENTGRLSVRLARGSGRLEEEKAMNAMRDALSRVPGLQYEFGRPALLSFSNPVEIEIVGYDLVRLREVSKQLVTALNESDRFEDVRTTVETGNPEIQVVFDHDRAANLGLAVRDIADRLVANVRGDVATRYSWRDRKIDVVVRSVEPDDSSTEEIRNLIVNPASDRPVTLDAVAEIQVALGPAEIRRSDQERIASITANLRYGDLGAAVAEVESILGRTAMPFGLTASISGQNEEMRESIRSLQWALALAIFLVYLVMASQFESLVHPFVIIFTIPLALVGAVLALFVTGTTINVVALIGVIMLAGIVVNNAIVLVDLINQLRAQGMERGTAIIEAAEARLRPILMTTLTTALGLLPMAISIPLPLLGDLGQAAEVRAPMAITVIGGLLVSTLLTLLVIPVVYSLTDRKKFKPAYDPVVT